MSPELRERMEKAKKRDCWQNVSLYLIYEAGFDNGAEWMHDNEVVPRDELLIQIKNTIDAFATDTISSLVVTQFHFNKLWDLRLKIEQFQKGDEK